MPLIMLERDSPSRKWTKFFDFDRKKMSAAIAIVQGKRINICFRKGSQPFQQNTIKKKYASLFQRLYKKGWQKEDTNTAAPVSSRSYFNVQALLFLLIIQPPVFKTIYSASSGSGTLSFTARIDRLTRFFSKSISVIFASTSSPTFSTSETLFTLSEEI